MNQFLMKYQLLYIFIILLIEFTYLIPNVDLKKKIIALNLYYIKKKFIFKLVLIDFHIFIF
jgi:hypothetical protein